MLRFKIVGVDRQSLQDVATEIEALNEDNAKVKADLKGIVLTSIEPCLHPAENMVTVTELKKSKAEANDDQMYCLKCGAPCCLGITGGSGKTKKVCPSCVFKQGLCPFCYCHLEDKNYESCSVCRSSWGAKLSFSQLPKMRAETAPDKKAAFHKRSGLSLLQIESAENSTGTDSKRDDKETESYKKNGLYPDAFEKGLHRSKQRSEHQIAETRPGKRAQPVQEKPVICPKCGSEQIAINKRGFSGGNALVGAVVFGGIGLLGGTIGSGKIELTCLKCGKKWKLKRSDLT